MEQHQAQEGKDRRRTRLELKSIAGHCKKVLYKGCLFVGFLAACGLASCSDDDESAAAPVFPELQSFSCNIGETKEFTFAHITTTDQAALIREIRAERRIELFFEAYEKRKS